MTGTIFFLQILEENGLVLEKYIVEFEYLIPEDESDVSFLIYNQPAEDLLVQP